jgi:hypothetical protein
MMGGCLNFLKWGFLHANKQTLKIEKKDRIERNKEYKFINCGCYFFNGEKGKIRGEQLHVNIFEWFFQKNSIFIFVILKGKI